MSLLRRRRGNPHTSTPVHYGVPTGLTSEHERNRVMAERLHRVWHSTPCASPDHIRCELLTRAYATVRLLGPLMDMYLVEAVEQARADLQREWGE